MFHVGVALLVLLVPSVVSCGEKVGNLRAAILPQDPEAGRGHIHVVVFGKRIPAPPLKVTLEVGDRFVKPSNYKLLSNATFGAGYDVDFALSGDYSYDMFVLCPPAQPRVTVENSCGNRASPKSYRALNSTKYEGRAEGVEFALAGDYSYDPQVNCIVGKPRVSVQGLCGYIEIYDLKPVYEGDLGDKKHRLGFTTLLTSTQSALSNKSRLL